MGYMISHGLAKSGGLEPYQTCLKGAVRERDLRLVCSRVVTRESQRGGDGGCETKGNAKVMPAPPPAE